jgi:signal transduction histidine kinase
MGTTDFTAVSVDHARRHRGTAAGVRARRSLARDAQSTGAPMSSARMLLSRLDATATGGMTKRYLFALGLVALLSAVAFLSLRRTIAAQETAAAIVNNSGKRRYTSQRAALYSLRLATTDDPAVRREARERMLASIATMELAHDGLIHGSEELHLPGRPSPAIARLYFEGPTPLDPLVREYISRVRGLAAQPDDRLGPGHPDLAWILAVAPGQLLDSLDSLVGAYQNESEREIARLQDLETTVFTLTLAVLTLEALLIFRPMVARVREERDKLVRAEAYTRSILDNSYDAILTIDRSGVIASANPAVKAMFASDRLVGQPFNSLIGAMSGAPAPWDTPSSGIRSLTAHRADGRMLALDVSFGAMVGTEGRRTVAIMRESTEALQRYARDLERRNQELDQFAYVTAHDLKAPLRAIVNLAAWIEEDAKAGVDHGQHLTLLRSRVRRLEALIDGIHQYAIASRGSVRLEEVDVALLVREIVDEHDPGHRFTLEADDLPRLLADHTRLWQVFANLIANAIKHHHRGEGTITVTARDEGDLVRFTVRDDGPGIAAQHHERIFVIFQTLVAKDVKEGLGLGLALARKIVREQGGTIAVESVEGQGAAFSFTWPRHRLAAD